MEVDEELTTDIEKLIGRPHTPFEKILGTYLDNYVHWEADHTPFHDPAEKARR